MKQNRTSAFTLVELLVVVGIILILASLLFPLLASIGRSADNAACIGNMKIWGNFLSNWELANNGQLPPIVTAKTPYYALDVSQEDTFFYNDRVAGQNPTGSSGSASFGKLPIRTAYCPGWEPGYQNSKTGEWLDYQLVLVQPDFAGAEGPFDDAETLSQQVNITVDNKMAGFTKSSESPGWTGYTGGYPDSASNSQYYTSVTTCSATWSFSLPVGTGTLEVWVYYTAQAGRTDKALYTVDTGSAPPQTFLKSQLDSTGWHKLGDVFFTGGATRSITVSFGTGGTGVLIADAIRVNGAISQTGVSPVNAYVDDSDGAPAYTETPAFTPAGGGYDGTMKYCACSSSPSATWRVSLPEGTGKLTVEAYWVDNANRTTQAMYAIDTGTATVSVGPFNQHTATGWHTIATDLDFTGGATRTITVTSAETTVGKYLIADGIYVHGSLTKEATGPAIGFEVLSGTWTQQSSAAAQGGSYMRTDAAAVDAATAHWKFYTGTAGKWGVYYKWPNDDSTLTSGIPITIQRADGTEVTGLLLDETTRPTEWVKLTDKYFAANTQYEMIISSAPTGKVAADAVMLAQESVSQQSQGQQIGYLYLGYRTWDNDTWTKYGDWDMPSSLTDTDSPSSTPILVDRFSTSQPSLSAHRGEVVHELMMDGSVRSVSARDVIRGGRGWQDAYGVTYGW